MTTEALLIGGPGHGRVWALPHPREVLEYAQPEELDTTDTEVVRYTTHAYRRRRIALQVPLAALIADTIEQLGKADPTREVVAAWNVYTHPEEPERADAYLAMVQLLLALTGRLATGGAGVTLSTLEAV